MQSSQPLSLLTGSGFVCICRCNLSITVSRISWGGGGEGGWPPEDFSHYKAIQKSKLRFLVSWVLQVFPLFSIQSSGISKLSLSSGGPPWTGVIRHPSLKSPTKTLRRESVTESIRDVQTSDSLGFGSLLQEWESFPRWVLLLCRGPGSLGSG